LIKNENGEFELTLFENDEDTTDEPA
jgi:hypothetical protein